MLLEWAGDTDRTHPGGFNGYSLGGWEEARFATVIAGLGLGRVSFLEHVVAGVVGACLSVSVSLCFCLLCFVVGSAGGLMSSSSCAPAISVLHVLYLFCMVQAAGIESGDVLYKLDGVPLGSYKEGLALFRNKTGPVVITCIRQDDVTV